DGSAPLADPSGYLPRDLGERIRHGRHNSPDAGSNDRLRARRSFPLMATRLKRHVQGRASGRLARLSERVDLGMGFSEALMPSFAYGPIFLNDNRSDQRIRFHIAAALVRQIEGAGHPHVVAVVHASTLPKEKP